MGTVHFSDQELMCKCGCGRQEMHIDFLELLETLREAYGSPMVLSSAYRCPSHNQAVSTTGTNGPHTTGRAVDVAIQGEEAYKLLALALDLGFTGIGIAQKGGGRFIHLDDLEPSMAGPRPRVWSY